MKIIEVTDRTVGLIEELLGVWEGSVKATHLFLSDEEIKNIKQYVSEALENIPVLVVAEDEIGNIRGFMGVEGRRLEMLFVSNEFRGQGIGTELLKFGLEKYSIDELTVNEQNPLAQAFYERMEFKVYKRTALDEQGAPYPLLYMSKTQ